MVIPSLVVAAGAHSAMAAPPTTLPHPICEYPWTPDQGEGTYRNPVLCADYSDPDVVRDGDDFYLTASSFNCTPGLPILHSRDLVNWTIIGHALKHVPGVQYDQPQHGAGVWAPAIRKHDGKFWIFFPTPDEGIYVTTAADPRGPWSEPHLLLPGKGLIDPCPLWDDDGKAYLVHAYARSRAGIKNKLRVRPMAPDGSKVLGEGEIVFEDAERHPTLEGPKFHKLNGYYYLSAPAGGVGTGWQLILRSKNVYGPYEPKVVLAQGSTPINGPHQGALVDLPNGDWWFVHFQEQLPVGRIIHLQPVTWTDGWPLMGTNPNAQGVGAPVLRYAKPKVATTSPVAVPQTSDEFDSDRLGLQWQWHANYKDNWHSLSAKRGSLRLFPQPVADLDLFKAPNLLLQKLPANAFRVSTRLSLVASDASERAGLVVMGLEHAALSLQRQGEGYDLIQTINKKDTVVERLAGPDVDLILDYAPDGTCTFSYKAGGGGVAKTLPVPFKAQEGRWIGAKVGLFSITSNAAGHSGHADFDYFRFEKPAKR
jgi:beta-xylosidase